MTYNGGHNRETWIVNLHFGDLLSEYIREQYSMSREEGEILKTYQLAEIMETFFDTIMEEEVEKLGSFLSDYLDFSHIEWEELAEAYISDIQSSN